LSLALAAGTQFSLAILALVALPLMLWVAPVRPRAVIAIWIAAVAVGIALLFAFYTFQPGLFWQAMARARWVDFHPTAFSMPASYSQTWRMIAAGSPPFVLALPVGLIAYCVWRRARYFGNTAPLLIAALLFILTVGSPDFPGQGFLLALLMLLFVFIAGVFADLLETRQGVIGIAGLWGLLSAGALWNVLQLVRLR